MDIISNFKPKIMKYGQKMGETYFNKYCFFAFRTKYEDDNHKELGKTYTVITMCLDKETSQASLDKFSADFKKNCSEFIFKEPQYMKIQNYRLKQNIQIQYFDPLAKIDPNNPKIPNFYTSFSTEGLVLNKEKNLNPLKVEFSFRFDQLVDCTPKEAASLKAILPEKLANLYKPDDCCVSYLVDWSMKGVKNMFCSMYPKIFRCKTDIKIFQSTMYEYCIADKIEKFNLLMKKHNNDLTKAKLYFLEQAAIINFLKEIIDKNLENFQNPNSKLFKDIVELKKNAKQHRQTALKLFEKDTNKDSKEKNPTCKEIIDGALDKKPEKKDESKDFEKSDRAQEKAENTNGAQALKMINKYKKQYCQELKDLQINDDKKKPDDKKEKDEKPEKDDKPKKDDENKKKPDTIKNKLNDIKKMAMDTVNHCKTKEKFTPNEALKLTNVILKHHKLFEKVHKKKINIPKKICKELKNKPDEGVINLEKLANEKKDKFNFDKEVAPPVPPKKDEQNPLKREEDEAKKQDLKVNKF
jgi:hypothetical protein